MAYISRAAATNGHRPNGLSHPHPPPHGEFEAPPSTMAAQLINDISIVNEPLRSAERDDLQRLIAEISESENQIVEAQSPEAKAQHAHKLIYVFALTVLDRLASDDPFLNIPQMVSQASDALEVFIIAIKETPGIFDYVLQPDEILRSRGQEPVWIWLFPKILVLLGRNGCDSLTEKIRDFFFESYQAVAQSPKLWDLSFSFFTYLKDCVSTLLGNLQSPAVISCNTQLDVFLPSREIDNLFFSQHEDESMGSTPHCSYRIRDPSEGLCHVTNVLSVLAKISSEAARSYDATSAFQDYLAWTLDSILSLHELHKRRRETPQLPQFNNKLEESSFETVYALIKAVKRLMSQVILHKSHTLLAILCADLVGRSADLSGDAVRVTICSSLLSLSLACRDDDSMYRLVSFHLSPTIIATLENGIDCLALGADFKKSAVSFCESCQIEIPDMIVGNVSESFQSDVLNSEFRRLDLRTEKPEAAADDQGPPTKRRKMSNATNPLLQVVSALYSILGHQDAADLYGLHQIAEESFGILDDENRSKVISYLSLIPCAISGTLILESTENPDLKGVCSMCEAPSDKGNIIAVGDEAASLMNEAITIFEKLIQSPHFIELRRTRILAMFALRRFAHHVDTPKFLDLNTSLLGRWCVRSLTSSLRELRIAASRTIPFFLHCNSRAKDTTSSNRAMVMTLLRRISEENPASLQETCVLTWAQLGRVLDDEHLVYVLLELVKYLGHHNTFVWNVAFNEILGLAKARKSTVKAMFGPFWDVIAYETVRHLATKPQTTERMADLLDMSVEDFLIFTQSFSLPYLVLNKHYGVIKRISQARKDDEQWFVCFDTSNLVRILALLLQQNVTDMEDFIMSLLIGFDHKFKENDLTDFMKIEPSTTAYFLLLAAGEADEKVKSRIIYALETIAKRAPSTQGSQKKKKSDVGLFLEQHILGLANRFIEVIMATSPDISIIERKRSVKGIEEFVKVARKYSRVARPHLCSCLQSVIATTALQQAAFSAWDAMLRNLEDEDVEAMLESTFSIILQHWATFDGRTQSIAHKTLKYLLKDRVSLIRNSIFNLPSLAQFGRLADIEAKLQSLRTATDQSNALQIFCRRLGKENSGVVYQALTELKVYLGKTKNQEFLQNSAVSEQPDLVVGLLVRSILDTCVKFSRSHHDIAQLSAQCIGLIGCLDPNRVESVRERREMILITNFQESAESTDFVLFVLQEVLVPAFLSTTDTSLQGFFSYSMQKLLEAGGFREVCGPLVRSGERGSTHLLYLKWQSLPDNIRDTLTPFLSSRYTLADLKKPKVEYPIFGKIIKRGDRSEPTERLYGPWLRTLVSDLLSNPFTVHAEFIFPSLSRAIRIKDTTVANFLLPYLVMHVILQGSDQNRSDVKEEFLSVLAFELPEDSKSLRREEWKSCLETVFHVLDYLSRWVQARQLKANQPRGGEHWAEEIVLVKSVAESIPAEILSQRATECKSYSRGLFYWEQHIRAERMKGITEEKDHKLLQRMQEIYSQIDEPDGIEGISAQLHVLDIEQQIIGHQKAGRWTAAQAWYEIKLAEKPDDADIQVNLLNCLKESGQHDVLLNYVEGMKSATPSISRLLPFATEASWSTGRWEVLEKYTSMAPKESEEDFNIRVGQALLALHNEKGQTMQFRSIISSIREKIACSLSEPMTASLADCHDTMLKLHVLTELEMIAGTNGSDDIDRASVDRGKILESLNRRIEVIGAYLNDKQYLLGIRRAAMNLSALKFENGDIAEAWLTSARLARKGNAIHQSFNAVLHASQLGDKSATIEHARLIWKEGNHRKAIGILEGAIKTNAFISHNKSFQNNADITTVDHTDQQNLLKARAHLMLAKWQDTAGQTNSATLRTQYQQAARTHAAWEKGHYYLGRHYNKLLQTEELLPAEQQKESTLTGEAARLIIENYLRSLTFGTKYIYQTLPRILTLWLDLGNSIGQVIDPKFGNSKEFVNRINTARKSNLNGLHQKFNKYVNKMPAYMFYTAFPQILSRISHLNIDVSHQLQAMIVKVVTAYPQHTLWNLLAVCTSNRPERQSRGMTVLQAIQNKAEKKSKGEIDIRALVKNGNHLTNQLLAACNNGDFPNNRNTRAHLVRDLHFNQKICTPSLMVVPFESVLRATLPTLPDRTRTHKAFSSDVVTIDSFQEEVLILSSLQKPRKLTAVGSDGRSYGLLCKPKDDLRKDQRLMEFNSMINRALKRNAEASRRQLYIKTYAVTPLNEECGIIEWVDGLKTFRDILLALYKPIGINPNYKDIEYWCEAHLQQPTAEPSIFVEKVLKNYPPIFHKWFVQQFPEPSTWFAARIRYTRSCAVMSMVGTILGLGDRHGENILCEEGNGGTFHVDFNCLFDKGLTFTKPENVPFRLTHNMTDAMGMYNYEGPFRKSCEITLQLCRQHEETLMTILEAFVYDPTLDLLNKKPEKKSKQGVPQTAQGVLDSIQRKVRGFLRGETVPLGVEGQVEELIRQATNHDFLAGMYIGWCSFL